MDVVIRRVLAVPQPWVQGLPGMPEELVAESRRVFLDNRDQAWQTAPAAAQR